MTLMINMINSMYNITSCESRVMGARKALNWLKEVHLDWVELELDAH